VLLFGVADVEDSSEVLLLVDALSDGTLSCFWLNFSGFDPFCMMLGFLLSGASVLLSLAESLRGRLVVGENPMICDCRFPISLKLLPESAVFMATSSLGP
jgi:hypothetical protein